MEIKKNGEEVLTMKHMIHFAQYSAEELEYLIGNALKIKSAPKNYVDLLRGKKVYMLFQKTSTRTALSFSAGIYDLGGYSFSQNWKDSNFAVADIRDEVRYVGRNADLIVARLKEHRDIETMAQYSTVPVVNGCCNKFHPCQALADLLTINELFGSFHIKMLYIGVHNNVLNSLAESLPCLGSRLYALTPVINEASRDDGVIGRALETGNYFSVNPDISAHDLRELVKQMDVIYTDSWIDMEFFHDESYRAEKERRFNAMIPYQLNERFLEGSKAVVMHDMPIHCGFEIERGVVEKNADVILQQAENRRHAQNALLAYLLGVNV